MDFDLRPACAADAAFLTEMLAAAAFWRSGGPTGSVQDVVSDPHLAHYVAGWPQPGDIGVVAEIDRPIGAAWLRYFMPENPGYGFIDPATPEIAMGVAPAHRSAALMTCASRSN